MPSSNDVSSEHEAKHKFHTYNHVYAVSMDFRTQAAATTTVGIRILVGGLGCTGRRYGIGGSFDGSGRGGQSLDGRFGGGMSIDAVSTVRHYFETATTPKSTIWLSGE